MARSPFNPETEFKIVRSDTPVTVDGFALHELTGEVRCLECDQIAENIDEIPHQQGCSQRFVRTSWWREQMRR